MNQKLALLLIGAGASLWGMIGLFVTQLYKIGFTPTQVVAMRTLSAALLLVAYVFFKDRRLLKIQLSDSKYFSGYVYWMLIRDRCAAEDD